MAQSAAGIVQIERSRQEFANWARTTFVSWTERLPAERHGQFIDDVLDRYSSDRVFTFYQLLLDFA